MSFEPRHRPDEGQLPSAGLRRSDLQHNRETHEPGSQARRTRFVDDTEPGSGLEPGSRVSSHGSGRTKDNSHPQGFGGATYNTTVKLMNLVRKPGETGSELTLNRVPVLNQVQEFRATAAAGRRTTPIRRASAERPTTQP